MRVGTAPRYHGSNFSIVPGAFAHPTIPTAPKTNHHLRVRFDVVTFDDLARADLDFDALFTARTGLNGTTAMTSTSSSAAGMAKAATAIVVLAGNASAF